MTRIAFFGLLGMLGSILAGCGGGNANREQLLVQLREAMERNVEAEADLQTNNQVVVEVREAAALSQMTRAEVEAAIGRGEQCGGSGLCAEQEFLPTDWYWDVGRVGGGLPGGPTLILGFDAAGRVERHYTRTRE